ncbi:hypothetical protein KEM48_002608 [Puccinia striiformis f. sp. tritici PST-130]|nr:hypothetical protein KEM48_002608 [Puccinia striiformis f. sp. tritici PST-130]
MGIPPYRSQPDKFRQKNLNMELEIPPFQEKGPISNSIMQAPKETRGIHPQSSFSNPEIQKSKTSQISPANHQLEEEPEELSTKESNNPKKEGRIFVGNNKVDEFIDKFGCNKITYKPALGYTPKKSAIMDLSRIIKSTIKKGGINTSEELHYFRIQFETMDHFFVSHQYITHIDQFTKLLWKSLSPKLEMAISDPLIWDGHLILNTNFSIAELPPYDVVVLYIQKEFRYRKYPEEASKKFQVKQENKTSNQQEFIVDSPEDHSPVDTTEENYSPEHMSLTPCTLARIGEKKDSVNLDHEEGYFAPEIPILEGALIEEKSQAINHEPALDPVEVAQYPEIKSVETSAPTERSEPPEETRAAGDHACLVECHSESDWNFQYEILSEKSSTNISETIKTLDFEEESLLHQKKLDNYLAAVLKPSQPASLDNVEKAISQTMENENCFLKNPGKSNSPHILEKICKSISQMASFNSPDTTGMISQAFKTTEINWNHLEIPWSSFAAGIVLLTSLFWNCVSRIGLDCSCRQKKFSERKENPGKQCWNVWHTAWTKWRGGTISMDLLRKVTRPSFQMDSIQWFDGRRWCRTMRNLINIAKKKKDCLETLNIKSGRKKDSPHRSKARGPNINAKQHEKHLGKDRHQLLVNVARPVVHPTQKRTRNLSAYLNERTWSFSIVRQMLSNSKLFIAASFFVLVIHFFLPVQSVTYERTCLNLTNLFSSYYSERGRRHHRAMTDTSPSLPVILFQLVEPFASIDGHQASNGFVIAEQYLQDLGSTHTKKKLLTTHTNLGSKRLGSFATNATV